MNPFKQRVRQDHVWRMRRALSFPNRPVVDDKVRVFDDTPHGYAPGTPHPRASCTHPQCNCGGYADTNCEGHPSFDYGWTPAELDAGVPTDNDPACDADTYAVERFAVHPGAMVFAKPPGVECTGVVCRKAVCEPPCSHAGRGKSWDVHDGETFLIKDAPEDCPTTQPRVLAVAVAIRRETIEECITAALEQRCERGTAWDRACVTIAEALRRKLA